MFLQFSRCGWGLETFDTRFRWGYRGYGSPGFWGLLGFRVGGCEKPGFLIRFGWGCKGYGIGSRFLVMFLSDPIPRSGKVQGLLPSPPLRTGLDTFASSGSSLISSDWTWICCVPAYDTLGVDAQGFQCRFVRLLQQVLYDGFQFPHRWIKVRHR